MKLFRQIYVLASDNKQTFDQVTKTRSNAKDSKTNADTYTVLAEEEVVKKVGNLEVKVKEAQTLTSLIKLEPGNHLVEVSASTFEGKIYFKILKLADVAQPAPKK